MANPNFGLSFDWETTGSDWEYKFSTHKYQGITLGMVIFDFANLMPIADKYIEFKFDSEKFIWTKEAEAIHGLSIEYLRQNGLSREEGLVQVLEFLLKWFGPDPVIPVLGHNVEFDIAFMQELFQSHELHFKPAHRKFDTASISQVLFGNSRSDFLFDTLGLDKRGLHNALDDAKLTLEAARRLRLIMNDTLFS